MDIIKPNNDLNGLKLVYKEGVQFSFSNAQSSHVTIGTAFGSGVEPSKLITVSATGFGLSTFCGLDSTRGYIYVITAAPVTGTYGINILGIFKK